MGLLSSLLQCSRVRLKEDTEMVMTAREAIRILMLSPIYFKIPPNHRLQLIKDYCTLYISGSEKKK